MTARQASSITSSLLRRSCARSSTICAAPQQIQTVSISRQFATVQSTRSLHVSSCWSSIPQTRSQQLSCQRFYSTEEKPSALYKFEDIKTISAENSPSKILVDVREPGELTSTGTIPHAINIPVSSSPQALFLPAEEFEDKFGFEKPQSGSEAPELIFFCKAGVRSRAAAELARRAGYENVGEYGGSWLDWEKNGGDKVPWRPN